MKSTSRFQGITLSERHDNHLKFLDDHEAEQSVQSVQAKCTQCVLDLREQPVVGHLLMALQVVPGVQLVDVGR